MRDEKILEAVYDVLMTAGVQHAQLRRHYAEALYDAGLLPTKVQWGLRYKNLDDEWVYSTPAGTEDAEASARRAQAPGDVLLRRYTTEWEVVE